MAQKAEEYGSHPTTFELAEAGTVTVTAEDGTVLMSFECEAGDILMRLIPHTKSPNPMLPLVHSLLVSPHHKRA